ncbi:MAG: molybdopterin-guanine dinucleotide biosynthesis protein B [Anaerolineae bacterium]
MKSAIPIVSIVGCSKSGKTTLLEKLIRELKRRGYRVAVIKHHYHAGFEFDVPGKDSYRFTQAGADHVVVAAPDKVAQVRHYEHEPTLAEIVADVHDVDLIFTEGYKRADAPKIEVSRRERSSELLCAANELIAIASDQRFDVEVPQFDLADVAGLADLIEGLELTTVEKCR